MHAVLLHLCDLHCVICISTSVHVAPHDLLQGGDDACQGDSGGPMILEGAEPYQDVQLGIVSFGGGCGRPGGQRLHTAVNSIACGDMAGRKAELLQH